MQTCTVVVETVEQSTQPSRIGARVIPTHEQTHCPSKVKGVTPERTSALEGTSPLCFPITVMDPKSRKGVTLDATKGLFEWNVMSLKSPKKIYLTKSKENELFGGLSLEELRQAQEDDADIAPAENVLHG